MFVLNLDIFPLLLLQFCLIWFILRSKHINMPANCQISHKYGCILSENASAKFESILLTCWNFMHCYELLVLFFFILISISTATKITTTFQIHCYIIIHFRAILKQLLVQSTWIQNDKRTHNWYIFFFRFVYSFLNCIIFSIFLLIFLWTICFNKLLIRWSFLFVSNNIKIRILFGKKIVCI